MASEAPAILAFAIQRSVFHPVSLVFLGHLLRAKPFSNKLVTLHPGQLGYRPGNNRLACCTQAQSSCRALPSRGSPIGTFLGDGGPISRAQSIIEYRRQRFLVAGTTMLQYQIQKASE
jgi:hypothetical protein